MRDGHTGSSDVVVDLDGVLSTKDTFTALLVRRFIRAPGRIVAVMPALWAWVTSRGDPERNAAAARRVAQLALRGLDEAAYESLAQDLTTRIAADPSWVHPEVIDLVRTLRGDGRRIIVATATERRLAELFLEAIGVDWDMLVASEISWGIDGPQLVAHRRGAAKLAALRDAGVIVEACRFYTDSFDDRATAEAAAELILVHPSRQSVQRYAATGVRFAEMSERTVERNGRV
jgi:phosphatidylglycerophosphatase C